MLLLFHPGLDQAVWTDLRQTRAADNDGSACVDAECDGKDLVWTDGSAFAFDATVFPTVNLESGEWCTSFDPGTRNLNSASCTTGTGLPVVCQIDCNPSK